MVQDPYKVLGVAQGASQDEIKKAYRRKAKENHPDLHPDDPNATQKMNEINEAYDMLMNPAKYQQRREQEQARQQAHQAYTQGYGGYQNYGGNSYGSYQGQSYGNQQNWNGGFDFDDFFGFGFGGPQSRQSYQRATYQPGEPQAFRRAIDSMNMGQYQQATMILNNVLSTMRNARWYYLSALAYNGAGNTVQAMDAIRRAVQMDPNNLDYRRLHQQMQQYSTSYAEQGRSHGMDMGGMNNMCMTMCLANLFCSLCCGGRGFFCC